MISSITDLLFSEDGAAGGLDCFLLSEALMTAGADIGGSCLPGSGADTGLASVVALDEFSSFSVVTTLGGPATEFGDVRACNDNRAN